MPKIKKRESILGLFASNERKVKKLYKLYYRKFPQHKKIWIKLSKKQSGRLKIMKYLNEKFKGGDKFFKLNEFSWHLIDYAARFIDREIQNARMDKIFPRQALGVALSLERSVAEKPPLEMFKPLSREIENVFASFNREADHHIKILARAYER